VAHKPEHLSFEEAATIPVAFLTAYYGLVKLAKLKKGERVLIHSAAGGVGLAAVKIAQYLGVEIYATAGNDEKRSFLHSLGLRHVMNSRNLDFVDDVTKSTEGKGVHVVLNSLAGEFIPKSLSLLAPYGRFIEIGMKDLLNDTPLGLRPFLKSLSYTSFFLASDLPDISSVWVELIEYFRKGLLTPLPFRKFSIGQVAEAFEYMTRGTHIGKIVVVQDGKETTEVKKIQNRDSAQPYRFFFPVSGGIFDRANGKSGRPSQETAQELLKDSLLPGEGVEVFKRILAKGNLPQVVVSTTDLYERIKKSRYPEENWLDQKIYKRTQSLLKHPRPELSSPFIPPDTEAEKKLAHIWQELLGIEQVGVNDDFFELGGDSLKAVSIVSRTRKELGIDIPVFTIFNYQTIRAFTQFLEKEQREKNSPGQDNTQTEILDRASQKMKQSVQRFKRKN